jgi:hypothetical protein
VFFKNYNWQNLVRIVFYVLPSFSCLRWSLCLSRSTTGCLHSLTPHDTSLTIIPLSINHQSTQYSHYLLQHYRYVVIFPLEIILSILGYIIGPAVYYIFLVVLIITTPCVMLLDCVYPPFCERYDDCVFSVTNTCEINYEECLNH